MKIRYLGAAMAALIAGTLLPKDAVAQMADPFIGEMRWVAFNFAPRGWSFCNGQLIPINQNQA